ncbi:hypothetical protein SARC_04908 [Sphaeroforma arctica JP610]|uniref:Uncharacterized protein n=1 Tax=Sphaeroforma arctica JP610 TaxID=667725 RepID=A0A0L0G161_9EUKA|nr:hypothetical protein SARC_04908 [Sphaeroforma arctica JP610]KNC82825.1 hypothetical protein SARC_04908 [Sphaeroforma arctica JP610]|eukprot:XP_014156727.1 hypothetical protein SARC_04908 [Sphaeroforma arctica JP610]
MQQQTQAWTAIAQTQKATDQSNVQDLTETIRKRGHDSATETSEAVHQKNEDTSQKVEHNNVIKTTLPTGESMNKASQSDHQDDKTSQSNRHIPQEALQSDHQGDKNCQQNRRVGKGTSQKNSRGRSVHRLDVC